MSAAEDVPVGEGGCVTYGLRDRVAWLTINRPSARNALNAPVREGLWEGFRRFNSDAEALALVLTGAGDAAFSAGADLKEMASVGMGVPPRDFVPQIGVNIEVPKPTIAAVNGAAYAGGFLLAQMCDLCIASENARFAVAEARVGRGAPWAAPLAWLVPPRVALQILMTAEPISARRAYEVGLVNELVPPSDLAARAQSLALAVVQNAPLSVRAAKEMVMAARRANRAYDQADALWQHVYLSEDAQEGPRAFAEGRPPRWSGK
jgi:enoyl-CoA hydratase/carnithine racemase